MQSLINDKDENGDSQDEINDHDEQGYQQGIDLEPGIVDIRIELHRDLSELVHLTANHPLYLEAEREDED